MSDIPVSDGAESAHGIPDSGPELLAFADAQMERIALLKREIAENAATYDLRKAQIDEWLAGANATAERQIARLEAMLLGIAGRITFSGHAKSKRLAFGTIGRAKAKDSVEVTDAARAVDFARTYGLPYAAAVATKVPQEIERLRAAVEGAGLKLTEAPLKDPLRAFVDANAFEVDEAEHGFKVIRGEDEPFVKIAEQGR